MPRKDIYKDAVPFKRQGDIPGDVPLGKTIGIRLPADIDTAIRALPEPTAWARQVLIQAAKRELLGESPAVNPGAEPPPAGDDQDNSPAVVAATVTPAVEVELLVMVNDLLARSHLSARVRQGLTRIKTYLENNHD